jgi:hypothetical protein
MSAPLAVVLILSTYGIVAAICHDTIWESLKLGESWAVATLVTILVTLFAVGTVL